MFDAWMASQASKGREGRRWRGKRRGPAGGAGSAGNADDAENSRSAGYAGYAGASGASAGAGEKSRDRRMERPDSAGLGPVQVEVEVEIKGAGDSRGPRDRREHRDSRAPYDARAPRGRGNSYGHHDPRESREDRVGGKRERRDQGDHGDRAGWGGPGDRDDRREWRDRRPSRAQTHGQEPGALWPSGPARAPGGRPVAALRDYCEQTGIRFALAVPQGECDIQVSSEMADCGCRGTVVADLQGPASHYVFSFPSARQMRAAQDVLDRRYGILAVYWAERRE